MFILSFTQHISRICMLLIKLYIGLTFSKGTYNLNKSCLRSIQQFSSTVLTLTTKPVYTMNIVNMSLASEGLSYAKLQNWESLQFCKYQIDNILYKYYSMSFCLKALNCGGECHFWLQGYSNDMQNSITSWPCQHDFLRCF